MSTATKRAKDAVTRKAGFVLWNDGEANRKPVAQRPCPCGCDERNGPMIGYISASNAKGEGITILAPDEETYQQFAKVFGEAIG